VKYSPERVGRTIQRLRKEKNMTQELLSGFAGIARSHLAMIENGSKLPRLDTVWRIADALEMTASQLLVEIERDYR